MKELFEKATGFFKRPFIRNVAIVASGTAAAQLIAIAFSPLITRIYGPEAFGLLGVFSALVAVVTPIVALTYPIAIVLPKDDVDAKGLAYLSLLVALLISFITAVFLVFAKEWLLTLLDAVEISPFAMLIPITMIFAAFVEVAQQWFIRNKQFSIPAKISVIQALVLNTFKVLIGIFKPFGAVLVIVSTAGQALQAIMLWSKLRWGSGINDNRDKYAISPFQFFKGLAIEYYDFPLYRAPQVFLNAFSKNLPLLVLATFFGPVSVGFFVIGRRVLSIPSQLISQSIGRVLYPRVSEAAHKGENLRYLILRATIGLIAVGIIPFGICFLFGPQVFSFVFGEDWIRAGEYARWLSIWLFFVFINKPSVVAIPVLKIQKWFLLYEAFSILINMFALFSGYFFFKSDLVSILLFSVVGSILYIWLLVKVLLATSQACLKQDIA